MHVSSVTMLTRLLTFLKNLTFGSTDSQRCECSNTDKPLKKINKETSQTPNVIYFINNTINRLTPDGKTEELATKPDWINSGTGVSCHGLDPVYVSTSRDRLRDGWNIARVTASWFLKWTTKFESLPDLPEAIYEPGVMNTNSHIYVFGGWRHQDGELRKSRTVNCLCLKKMLWKTCDPLLQAVIQPVSLLHDGQIHIIGSNSDGEEAKSFQTYNIMTSQCTTGKQLPFPVQRYLAQAIVYKGKLRIVLRNDIITYEPTSNEWMLKKFEDLEGRPVVYSVNGKLCATIWLEEGYIRKEYDEEDNQWKIVSDDKTNKS